MLSRDNERGLGVVECSPMYVRKLTDGEVQKSINEGSREKRVSQ